MNPESLVRGVGTESAEVIRRRVVAGKNTDRGADLAGTENGSAGRGKVVEHNMIGAFGELEGSP